jgi:hypothetical protein
MDAGGRFTTAAANGIVWAAMNELRALHRAVGLGQREFAALPSIPLETYRPWDSGRRVVPVAVLERARDAVDQHQRQPWSELPDDAARLERGRPVNASNVQ